MQNSVIAAGSVIGPGCHVIDCKVGPTQTLDAAGTDTRHCVLRHLNHGISLSHIGCRVRVIQIGQRLATRVKRLDEEALLLHRVEQG